MDYKAKPLHKITDPMARKTLFKTLETLTETHRAVRVAFSTLDQLHRKRFKPEDHIEPLTRQAKEHRAALDTALTNRIRDLQGALKLVD
jgi:hypothetical protein